MWQEQSEITGLFMMLLGDLQYLQDKRLRRRSDFRRIAIRPARLWYGEPNAMANAIGYAKHRSRSHDAVIRVYDKRAL
jgi:hypothetical protein